MSQVCRVALQLFKDLFKSRKNKKGYFDNQRVVLMEAITDFKGISFFFMSILVKLLWFILRIFQKNLHTLCFLH